MTVEREATWSKRLLTAAALGFVAIQIPAQAWPDQDDGESLVEDEQEQGDAQDEDRGDDEEGESLLGDDDQGASDDGEGDGGESLLGGEDEEEPPADDEGDGDLLDGEDPEAQPGDDESGEPAASDEGEPASGDAAGEPVTRPGEDPHAFMVEERYPTAKKCGECHQKIYEEWSLSSHAYASISPVFHKFEQKINDLTTGTIDTFCMRCHASVGTTLDEPRSAPLWERADVSREGVTCITCHRVKTQYGKANGERRIQSGPITDPVYGGIGGGGVREVLENKEEYNVVESTEERGLAIHSEGIEFEQINKSEFCVSCHQVAVHPGIKLEVVWDQYRGSPAHENGVSCQDCHMSKDPGQPTGYERTAVATLGRGKTVDDERKHANHMFVGPGYPIAHPGVFPHNRDDRFTMKEWLDFDWRAGWGTEEFEDEVYEGELDVEFPPAWQSVDDRYEAREIVDENLAKLEKKRRLRKELMEHSIKIDGPFFDDPPAAGEDLDFHYRITSRNSGHNIPSGSLGAQPELWLNVALVGPDGENLWESGYVDSNGDMADLHSLDVASGEIEHDDQLFNLQTKFLTTNVKGTDREMYLPVTFDVDQFPFIRPAPLPVTVLNHPPFVRMESRSITPLGSKDAEYSVDGDLLRRPGKYRLMVRMRSRAEPIYFMKFIESTDEMIRSMNEWMLDIHPYAVEFEVR